MKPVPSDRSLLGVIVYASIVFVFLVVLGFVLGHAEIECNKRGGVAVLGAWRRTVCVQVLADGGAP